MMIVNRMFKLNFVLITEIIECDEWAVLGAEGICRFPDFLFPAPPGRRLMYVWTTEARYRTGSSVADTEMEVTVRDGDTLITKLRHTGGLCAQQHSNVTCLHREFLYQRRCLERTDDDKFFVEQNDGMCVDISLARTD